jgi:capsular polysaccharide biosynthesis protein
MSGPRWLENSSDVEAALISLNFEVIVAESMTLTEQIEAFASAEIVGGLHGAGLTNIVFCRPGCAVVEIHPSDEIRNYFWLISEMINLRYHFLRGDGSMNLSIGVDTDRLLTLVRAAIRDL